MHLRTAVLRDHRPAPRRRRGTPATYLQALARGPLAPTLPRSDRLRSGGAPQDRALYVCGCGAAFHAPVSASVDCPSCGSDQTW
ncbi:unannotated protein [freshwater metagenome]|uniref:Unannotated protein n=1 Tax=freshwater metagenome TaxID=449393 RepID=A0A6J7HTM3_9ZZZZ|nr:hypothetical protein [Actinomycetota bacterium]